MKYKFKKKILKIDKNTYSFLYLNLCLYNKVTYTVLKSVEKKILLSERNRYKSIRGTLVILCFIIYYIQIF